MLRFILIFSVFLNISYAQNKRYYIQLGSFKQLAVLDKSIQNLPTHLRSHVVVVQSNQWFIPFAYHTTNRTALQQKLPAYRRYFHDAYINSSAYILQHRVVRNYIPKHRRTQPVEKYLSSSIENYPLAKTYPVEKSSFVRATPVIIQKPIKRKKVYKTKKKRKKKSFNKKMLSGRDYYLAYKSTKDSPNLLVKVSFKNHKVFYQPMLGDMNMKEARYVVSNERLYMFADSFSKDSAFSKIDGYTKNYILVSSWQGGKKMNTLRYYYRLNDAKTYLGEVSAGELATALQEGVFDGVDLPNY
jgi:hypothetical protein